MSKKIILIIGIILIVLIVGGVLIFINNNKSSNVSVNQSTNNTKTNNTIKDTDEEDLGLCNIVSISTIKSELGAAASNLLGPNNTGVTSLGDGDKGQTCVYPFKDGASVSNSFYIDLASYALQKTFDDVTQYSSDGITVNAGDVAYFTVSEPITSKSTEFTLKVQKDKKVYLFVISQPTDTITFTNDSAQTALTNIALASKL